MNEYDAIIDKYKILYRHGPVYIECPIEWLDIIDRLSASIEKLIIEKQIDVSVLQVKEKFNGLRFYTSISNKEINELIKKAEIEVEELDLKKNKFREHADD